MKDLETLIREAQKVLNIQTVTINLAVADAPVFTVDWPLNMRLVRIRVGIVNLFNMPCNQIMHFYHKGKRCNLMSTPKQLKIQDGDSVYVKLVAPYSGSYW